MDGCLPPIRPADTRTGGPGQEAYRAQAAQASSTEPVPFEIHDGYKGGFSVASERGG